MLAGIPVVVHVVSSDNTSAWPTIIAGAVGAFGGVTAALGGAWLNARSQMAALDRRLDVERDQAQQDSKRRTYSACLSALCAMPTALVEHRQACRIGDATEIKIKWDVLKLARVNAFAAVYDLDLIAPQVAEAAHNALGFFNKYASLTNKGANIGEDQEPIEKAVRELRDAMRKDLGELPIDADVSFGPSADPAPGKI